MSDSYLIVGGSSDIARVVATNLLSSGKHVTLVARDESRVSDLNLKIRIQVTSEIRDAIRQANGLICKLKSSSIALLGLCSHHLQ